MENYTVIENDFKNDAKNDATRAIESLLGNTCEICGGFESGVTGTLNQLPPRTAKFVLQSAARFLAPEKRVGKCLRVPTRSAAAVEIRVVESRAHFFGLQTCGSVWDCAVCSAKISERRSWEMNGAVNKWLASGGSVLLATYTLSHQHADSLTSVLRILRSAYRSMKSNWNHKKVVAAAAIEHDITALEVTHGRAGWHPHLHALIFCRSLSTEEQNEVGRGLGAAWQGAVKLAGGAMLPSVGFDLRGGDYAADYAAKWGVIRELGNAANKKARRGGRTPQQLLAAFALDGDVRAGRLWQDYSATFHGRSQLQWSRGAKAAFGIDDQTDGDVAALEPAADAWASIDLYTWRRVVAARRDLRDALLRLCEIDDRAGFDKLLESLWTD